MRCSHLLLLLALGWAVQEALAHGLPGVKCSVDRNCGLEKDSDGKDVFLGQCGEIRPESPGGDSGGFACYCKPGYGGTTPCSKGTPDVCNPASGEPPCKNGAYCAARPEDEEHPYRCLCEPANGEYGGHDCEINLCEPSPCANNGTCVSHWNVYANEYTAQCMCKGGWGGPTCEERLCEPNPCKNNGQCLYTPAVAEYGQIYPASAECKCPSPFGGLQCEVNACLKNPCKNRGNCSGDPYEPYFVCNCPADAVGQLCEIRPCLSKPCRNNGVCNADSTALNNYWCDCPSNVTGRRCEMRPCVNRCRNNATCTALDYWPYFRCACLEGTAGPQCERKPCEKNPCRNGGVCTVDRYAEYYYTCDCAADTLGSSCQVKLGYVPPQDGTELVFYRGGEIFGGEEFYFSWGETAYFYTAANNYQNEFGTPDPNFISGYNPKERAWIHNDGTLCGDDDEQDRTERYEAKVFFKAVTGANYYKITGVAWGPELPQAGRPCLASIYVSGPKQPPEGEPCDSSPCLNDGECTSSGSNYMCRCPDGFAGYHCEAELAYSLPDNGGVLSLTNGTSTFKLTWGSSASVTESGRTTFLGFDQWDYNSKSKAWMYIGGEGCAKGFSTARILFNVKNNVDTHTLTKVTKSGCTWTFTVTAPRAA